MRSMSTWRGCWFALERPEEAFSYAEKLRARSYLDLLSQERIPSLTQDQRRRESRTSAAGSATAEESRRGARSQLRAPSAGHGALSLSSSTRPSNSTRDFLSGLRTRSIPDLATTWTLAVPDATTIREVPANPQSVLLEFVVGSDEVLIFGLTQNRLTTHVAPLARKRSPRQGGAPPRRSLRRRDNTDWQYPAASLARILIEPLEAAGWLDRIPPISTSSHTTSFTTYRSPSYRGVGNRDP